MTDDAIRWAVHKAPEAGRFEIGLGNLTRDEAGDVLIMLRAMQAKRGARFTREFAPYNALDVAHAPGEFAAGLGVALRKDQP